MAGYRFCRSDDIPLLVAAHNACWVPHFGATHAITVESFKRGVRELGFWASSCMVAFADDEPIGVLIGAKRDGEANCVHRLAVRPGYERLGHGRHLLTSLANKAAILGPPRLVAEIPAEWTEIRRFFEKSGFVAEARYGDFVLAADAGCGGRDGEDPRAALIVPIGLEELVESGALDLGQQRAWGRTKQSLGARVAELEGVAVATDRIEAYVLFRPSREGADREVVAIGAAAGAQGLALLALLVERVQAGGHRVRIPMLSEKDVSVAVLVEMGFRLERETIGYVAVQTV
jgi:GNAT superfamily N-acetyltransferase